MAATGPGSQDKAIRTTEEAEKRSKGARLFDIRRLIGALFVLYGIVLIIVGLNDSKAEIRKAAGVHINLWTGIGMLVFGLLMLLWAFGRPVVVDDTPTAEDRDTRAERH
jgi:protein-S-isoprenylcysteine O-methyltransferase Ste14